MANTGEDALFATFLECEIRSTAGRSVEFSPGDKLSRVDPGLS